jgi:hypothetical protein
MKFPNHFFIERECESILDWIACEFTWEDITRFAGDEIIKILEKVPAKYARDMIADCIKIDNCYQGSGFVEKHSDCLLIPVGEIEVQLDEELVERYKKPEEEFFKTPEDWVVKGDLAYLCIDAVYMPVNLGDLQEFVDFYFQN